MLKGRGEGDGAGMLKGRGEQLGGED